jgi:hypothetical protein
MLAANRELICKIQKLAFHARSANNAFASFRPGASKPFDPGVDRAWQFMGLRVLALIVRQRRRRLHACARRKIDARM